MEIKPIAHIYTDFDEKFGIPRQSGLASRSIGKIVFENEYSDENFFRGIENFSHLWLIWLFSENVDKGYSPTVRPPKLGGNTRMGVFATRSPFRPNFIGLSSVQLLEVKKEKELGTVLFVKGADIMNNTPIFDIKPYLSYTDCHNDAKCGFTENIESTALDVRDPGNILSDFDESFKEKLFEILREDPRPSYHDDEREYSMLFSGMDIKFKVEGKILSITEIKK